MTRKRIIIRQYRRDMVRTEYRRGIPLIRKDVPTVLPTNYRRDMVRTGPYRRDMIRTGFVRIR